MTVRDELHDLIEELPEHELLQVQRLLRDLRSQQALARYPAVFRDAPLDDEPDSDAERALVAEAREEVARGEVLTTEELLRELGP